MERERLQIKYNKQILVEGRDAYYFFIQALEAYKIDNVQVVDFGGIKDLTAFIGTWKKLEHFHTIRSLLIVRDAEQSAVNAMRSIGGALREHHFPCPEDSYRFCSGDMPSGQKIRVGIILLPHMGASHGTLEDLCIETVVDDEYMDAVNGFLDTARQIEKLSHEHKSRVHAYLSVKNKYVGMKIGEAAKAGAWDWDSKAMKDICRMMEAL